MPSNVAAQCDQNHSVRSIFVFWPAGAGNPEGKHQYPRTLAGNDWRGAHRRLKVSHYLNALNL